MKGLSEGNCVINTGLSHEDIRDFFYLVSGTFLPFCILPLVNSCPFQATFDVRHFSSNNQLGEGYLSNYWAARFFRLGLVGWLGWLGQNHS
jgi:hypothetical protein